MVETVEKNFILEGNIKAAASVIFEDGTDKDRWALENQINTIITAFAQAHKEHVLPRGASRQFPTREVPDSKVILAKFPFLSPSRWMQNVDKSNEPFLIIWNKSGTTMSGNKFHPMEVWLAKIDNEAKVPFSPPDYTVVVRYEPICAIESITGSIIPPNDPYKGLTHFSISLHSDVILPLNTQSLQT